VKELLELFAARQRARHVPHALATVLRVEGSSYRRPGARMLINAHGRVAGSVSGGCLEKNVIARGQAVLQEGGAQLLSFDTTDQDDLAFGTSLGCQGKIWIGVESLPANRAWPLAELVEEARRRRQPAALITRIIGDGEQFHFESSAIFEEESVVEASGFYAAPREEIAEVLRLRKTRFVGRSMPDSTLVEWLGPPVSLLLFGGGPDVRPMARLARELGHEVTVIDRRPDFARHENFPEAKEVLLAKPHEVAALLRTDSRTAAVVMNHHYETDRDVLASILPLDLPYIAMLGPKRRTVRILEELGAGGHDVGALAESLHGPAGLDIGAETPEQIALAILAEMQATMTSRNGGKLRQRRAPIHAEAFTEKETPWVLPV
jgi:xanthine dehydrogenase accessory factor